MAQTPTLPKISIVTPSFNQGRFLETAMRSVLDQGYPNLEYIVIDRGSTDGSVDIIRRHADDLTYWVSEPDRSQYDAINKGFAHATGEIMAWLNADDAYCPWTLHTVAAMFRDLPAVQWITSNTQLKLDEGGDVIGAAHAPLYARTWFYRGWNLANQRGFKGRIQQEATFWRRSLWEAAGSRMDNNLQAAGDFELWARFWEHDNLAATEVPLAGWRRRQDQTASQMDRYYAEAAGVLNRYQGSVVRQRALVWLLGRVLAYTKRGGKRFGSLTQKITYAHGKGAYRCRYEFEI